jgi:hypothetical protein
MTEHEAMDGIRRAARDRAEADKVRRAATYRLRDCVIAAQQAGVSITRIAQEAGLSRQGVYDLLGHPPLS